jgi:glycine cleavage system H protein
VAKVNDSLFDKPETINEDPYRAGWLIEIELGDPSQVDALMSAADYKKLLAEQE